MVSYIAEHAALAAICFFLAIAFRAGADIANEGNPNPYHYKLSVVVCWVFVFLGVFNLYAMSRWI